MSEDSDLDTLRDHPRFASLTQAPKYPSTAGGRPVVFPSEGGWDVYGHLYESKTTSPQLAPNLLLFHQSGSNHAEYFPIAPRLAKLGYNCIAIDARGGGDSYGRGNETVTVHGERGGGAEAYFDFKAALRYLDEKGFKGKRVLWGSSYSAGRLFAVLADKPERVAAALAFSPGRAFARSGESGEASWASQVEVPVFVCMPFREFDAKAMARFEAIAGDDRWLYVPTSGGSHGSSMLRPDRNPQGHEAAWVEVLSFLEAHLQ